MLGQGAAIAKRPPHASGSTETDGSADPIAIEPTVAVTAVSTAAALVLSGGIPIGGCWVTFVADTDCFIHFGPSSSLPAASSTVSWPLAAGVEKDYWCNEKDQYFRVIRKTADGILRRARTNL